MSLGQGLQRSAAFRSNADLDLDAFRALCEQEVDPALVPSASAVVQRVPVYDATALQAATARPEDRRAMMAELNDCLLDGPGVFAVEGMMDPEAVDRATDVYWRIIEAERAAGLYTGSAAPRRRSVISLSRSPRPCSPAAPWSPSPRRRADAVTHRQPRVAAVLALWNHPGEDVFGMIARCQRVAAGAELLLGGEVYHYHSKLTMKRPGGGGRWEWHQDYGYWYQNGCLYPDMLSVAIALEPATRENGCMQVLAGSHKLGRLEHGRVAGQTGADPERVEQALERLELVHCEMEPGDALFFHANTLHCSAANNSDKSRNLLICCYNKASNDPYKDAPPSTLHAARQGAGRGGAGGRRAVGRVEGRWFLEAGKDETTDTRKAG